MSKMAEKAAAVDGAGAADAALAPAGQAAAARVRPFETLLRAAPLGLCVATMTVMLHDQQSNEEVDEDDRGGLGVLGASTAKEGRPRLQHERTRKRAGGQAVWLCGGGVSSRGRAAAAPAGEDSERDGP